MPLRTFFKGAITLTILTAIGYLIFGGNLKEKTYPEITVYPIIHREIIPITGTVTEVSGLPIYFNRTTIDCIYQGLPTTIHDNKGNGIIYQEEDKTQDEKRDRISGDCTTITLEDNTTEKYEVNYFTTKTSRTYKRNFSAGSGRNLTERCNERLGSEFSPIRDAFVKAIADSIRKGVEGF